MSVGESQMLREARKAGKHAFSIELKSKEHLKLIAMPCGAKDNVLFEGFLGDLEALNLVDGAMLEIQGSHGTFKMDLKEEELEKLFKKQDAPNDCQLSVTDAVVRQEEVKKE